MRTNATIAYHLMQSSSWAEAITFYNKAIIDNPVDCDLLHNIALCHLALQQTEQAITRLDQLNKIDPTRLNSRIVYAKAIQQQGKFEQAINVYNSILNESPQNSDASLGLAEIYLNHYGLPSKARLTLDKTTPELDQDITDYELTKLMCSLYEGNLSAIELTEQLKNFAKQNLDASRMHPLWNSKLIPTEPKKLHRVGLISPFFSVSPVYFLTFEFFRELSRKYNLVIFNRGTRSDWATEKFKGVAHEWFEVQHLDYLSLSKKIYESNLDRIYDLGGWSDTIGLKALSLRPAHQQFKWVGGQSATTGLQCFDGWIGDTFQSPTFLKSLYTEPLINFVDDYAFYKPPEYMPQHQNKKRSDAVVIFANPAKLSLDFLSLLKNIPQKKIFLHRQFRFEEVRNYVTEKTGDKGIEFITPENHQQTLEHLSRFEVMIDTFPYSGGLTAREANHLGVKIMVLKSGLLFCQRHSMRFI
jgi:protein O-GlcNAc transferase